jgi:hypothetical protein
MRNEARGGDVVRRGWSIALAVVGTVLLLVGSLLFYAGQAIFSSDGFANRAEAALEDERVRAALTVPIVDAIIDQGPDELINAQPLLETGINAVIGSPPFIALFKESVRGAHSAAFSEDTETLVLTLVDAGVVVISAIKSISPEIADQVPDDLELALVELVESDFALGTAALAHDVRVLGLILPFLGFAFLIGSAAVRRPRRDGIATAAAAVAIGSAVVLAALLVGRGFVLAQFDDDLVADSAAAIWSAFVGGYFTLVLFLGFVAVIVAAAAQAGLRQADPSAPFRRLGEIARWTPASPAGRFARATGILAVSLLFILQPEAGVSLIMVALGAWGLFIALTEMMLIVAPPSEEITAGAGERMAGTLGRIRWRRLAWFGGTAALIVVLALVLVPILRKNGPTTRPPGPVTACNGHAELCERTLDQVSFPATHNSMSAAREGYITPNQRNGLTDQLTDGIRTLLIDTHYGVPSTGSTVITDLSAETTTSEEIEKAIGAEGLAAVERGRGRLAFDENLGDSVPYLCHVMCELGATELTGALVEVREFLDTHPDEFVILFVEDVVTPEDAAPAFEESGILRYAYVHQRGAPFPTMRELIQADNRVLILGESKDGGARYPWYQDGFELVQETPFTFNSPQELAKPSSCDPNRGDGNSPMFLINNWVEEIPRSPEIAAEVNQIDVLTERAERCERLRGLLPNMLAVDYYDQGNVFGVANLLNGLAENAEPTTRTLR